MNHEPNPDTPRVVVGDTLYQAHSGRAGQPPGVQEGEVIKAGPVQLTIKPASRFSPIDRVGRRDVDNPDAWSNWSRTPEAAKRGVILRARGRVEIAHRHLASAQAELDRAEAAWPEVAS